VFFQALPQKAPRVDVTSGGCGRLLPPRGVCCREPGARKRRAAAAWLTPIEYLELGRLPQLQHIDRALGLRTSWIPKTTFS